MKLEANKFQTFKELITNAWEYPTHEFGYQMDYGNKTILIYTHCSDDSNSSLCVEFVDECLNCIRHISIGKMKLEDEFLQKIFNYITNGN